MSSRLIIVNASEHSAAQHVRHPSLAIRFEAAPGTHRPAKRKDTDMTHDHDIATLDGFNAITLMVDPAAALEAARRLEKATAACARRGGLSVRSALLDDDDDVHVTSAGGRQAPSEAHSGYERSSGSMPARVATRFLAVRSATPR